MSEHTIFNPERHGPFGIFDRPAGSSTSSALSTAATPCSAPSAPSAARRQAGRQEFTYDFRAEVCRHLISVAFEIRHFPCQFLRLMGGHLKIGHGTRAEPWRTERTWTGLITASRRSLLQGLPILINQHGSFASFRHELEGLSAEGGC